jgi:hypothetical protein
MNDNQGHVKALYFGVASPSRSIGRPIFRILILKIIVLVFQIVRLIVGFTLRTNRFTARPSKRFCVIPSRSDLINVPKSLQLFHRRTACCIQRGRRQS